MSKFQVGDKVQLRRNPTVHGTVRKADEDYDMVLVGGGNSGYSNWYRTSHMEHREPPDQFVPDVDGNPIRVGALVELVSNDEANGSLGWAVRVWPAHDGSLPLVEVAFAARNVQHQHAAELRVVTETRRPPEPDTRDVTLRVTFGGIGLGSETVDEFRFDVLCELERDYLTACESITVEVDDA